MNIEVRGKYSVEYDSSEGIRHANARIKDKLRRYLHSRDYLYLSPNISDETHQTLEFTHLRVVAQNLVITPSDRLKAYFNVIFTEHKHNAITLAYFRAINWTSDEIPLKVNIRIETPQESSENKFIVDFRVFPALHEKIRIGNTSANILSNQRHINAIAIESIELVKDIAINIDGTEIESPHVIQPPIQPQDYDGAEDILELLGLDEYWLIVSICLVLQEIAVKKKLAVWGVKPEGSDFQVWVTQLENEYKKRQTDVPPILMIIIRSSRHLRGGLLHGIDKVNLAKEDADAIFENTKSLVKVFFKNEGGPTLNDTNAISNYYA